MLYFRNCFKIKLKQLLIPCILLKAALFTKKTLTLRLENQKKQYPK